MGLLDALEDVARAVYSPVGLAVDLGTAPFNDDPEFNGGPIDLIGKRLTARMGDALTPADAVLGGTDEWVGRNVLKPVVTAGEAAYTYGISRPLATTQLLGAASEQRYGDDRGLAGLSIPFDPKVWRGAWNLSDDISPGQAIAENTMGAPARQVHSDFGLDTTALFGQMAAQGFDITNPADREAAFSHGAGRLASGTIDAVVRWKADPLVLAGGAAGAARSKVVTQPITEATDVNKALASNRITAFVDSLQSKATPGERMDLLMRNRAIRDADDGSALAFLLAHAEKADPDNPGVMIFDPDQARTVLRYAMDANAQTRRQLERHSADLANIVDNLRDTRIPSLQRALDNATPESPVEAFAADRIKAANAQLLDADRDKTFALMLARAEGSLRSVPRVTTGQRINDKVGWSTWQPSPYNVPLRIAKAATTQRAGVVDLNRADGIEVLRSFLDSSRLDNASKGTLLARYAAATDETAKQAAVHAAEVSALQALADGAGVSRDFLAKLYVSGFDARRRAAAERAYSGARTADGQMADMVEVDGVATRLPLDVPQLSDHVALIDLAAHEKVLRRYAAEIAADEDGVLNRIRGIPASGPAQFAGGHLTEIADGFNRLWKPAQLARLGYPLRVVSDEQVRAAATLGTLSLLKLQGENLVAQGPVALRGAADKLTRTTARRRAEVASLERRLKVADERLKTAADDAKPALQAKRDADAARLAKLTEKLEAKPQSAFGQGTLKIRGYEIEDAYGGAPGSPNIFWSASGSRPMWARLAGTNGRVLNDLRRARSESWVNLTPVQEGYEAAWERAVNQQIASSPPMRMMLEGADDDAVLRWLRTPEGKAYGRRVALRAARPEEWVAAMRAHVDTYLPDENLKALALQKKATAADLARAVPERFDRPVIHGESLDIDTGLSKVLGSVQNAIETIYAKLGAAPTDVLSRHPFFAGVYRQEVRRLLDRYDDAALSPQDLRALEGRAREHALRQTKRTLYELGTESNLSHAVRFVMPFYSAWAEVLTRWIGMSIDDPSRVAKGMLLWQSPNRAGLVVDSEGNAVGANSDVPSAEQYLVTSVPGWFKHVPGGESIGGQLIPKQALNTILSGDNPLVPGFGPIAAIPVAELVRDRPDQQAAFDLILPFGPGKDAIDLALPAAGRRIRSAEAEDRTYANSVVRIAQELEVERGKGRAAGEPTLSDTELAAEATRRAQRFWKLRTVANLVMPYSPRWTSPYQSYIDDAHRMRDEYSKLPGERDAQGRDWESAYLDKHGPDYFAFTTSLSKSLSSVAPTIEGYRAQQKFGDLLGQFPEQGSLIVGNADAGVFDQSVYEWQFGAEVGQGDSRAQRAPRDVREALGETNRAQGWVMWRKASTSLDLALAARGLTSFSASGAEDLAAFRAEVVRSLGEKFPDWLADYTSFDTSKMHRMVADLSTYVDDPRFDDRPGWQSLRRYLSGRQLISQYLRARDRAGGSANLQAAANTDLRLLWDAFGAKLRSGDTFFDDMHARFFSRDLLEDGG